ncbi:MAG TPA: hypothetical protein VLZ75_01135 [Chitinophagales bacterium]|nr:hypothetical protein [Chitinophagales bacterium]
MSKQWKHYAWIIVIGWLIYWPISFFIFGIKNDILTDYFPTRFFMSESLHAGYIPWWNPYVNFGIPQYAEMNSSYWSPITWLIAAIPGYSIYTIQLEVIFYIILGGLGVFQLGKTYSWNQLIKLMAAVTYMGMGFFTSHIQHLNWISPTAFLPWCIWALHQLVFLKSKKNIIVSALIFYLFISSSHPGFIIGGFYFFTVLLIYFIYLKNQQSDEKNLKIAQRILLFSALLGVLLAGLLYSYVEVLSHITHSTKPDLGINFNTTTIQSWLSFLLPSITNKNQSFFMNDISLRNCYLGITVLLFLIVGFWVNFRKQAFWYLIGIFFLYLSSDLPLVDTLKNITPLVSYVRLSASFRVFALISFIIIGFNQLQDYTKRPEKYYFTLKWVSNFWMAILSICLVFAVYKISKLNELDQLIANANSLKSIFDHVGFYTFLLISSLTSLVFLFYILQFIKKKQWNYLLFLCILDMGQSVILQLPYTGVGNSSPQQLQAMINSSPKGIPIPTLQNLEENNLGNAKITQTIGHWSYYNKQVGTLERASQPIRFQSEFEIFSDSSLNKLAKKPFVYFEITNEKSILPKIIEFNPNKITVEINNIPAGALTILYKQYPHWKITSNQRDISFGNKSSIFYSFDFPTVEKQIVKLEFNPSWVKFFQTLNLLILVCCGVYIIYTPKTS